MLRNVSFTLKCKQKEILALVTVIEQTLTNS